MLSLEQLFIRAIVDYEQSELVALLTDMVEHNVAIDKVVFNVAFGKSILTPLPQ